MKMNATVSADNLRYARGLMWFRRDLRVHDNHALHQALSQCAQVYAVFVLDRAILDTLARAERRVEFIHAALVELDNQLRDLAAHADAGLIVCHGYAKDEILRCATQLGVDAVFSNHDDEPYALARDTVVRQALGAVGVAWYDFQDQVVFERQQLLTQAGKPYTVFTPYKTAWLARVGADALSVYDPPARGGRLAARPAVWRRAVPALPALGFESTNLNTLQLGLGESGARERLQQFLPRLRHYHERRDFPAQKGPSYLSVHLRFGTLSIRELVRQALRQHPAGSAGATVWLSELIWRDFYMQILANFKHLWHADGSSASFKPAYDALVWEQGELAQAHFEAWCHGRTGYPLVDAAMRQLNQTGYMHNRLRMVSASFLCKHLGVDWRWGEAYFARTLNDFDLAANNGGWQWASSSGCDAQPYFRIFNPVRQSEKFDAQGQFIKKYLPELARLPAAAVHQPWLARPVDLAAAGVRLGRDYPHPVVEHNSARQRTLQRYALVRGVADAP